MKWLLILLTAFVFASHAADRHPLRSRPVTPDLQGLHKAVAALRSGSGKPAELKLELFPDATLQLRFNRIEAFNDGTEALVGKVEGDPYSSAVMVFKRGVVSANIATQGRLFQVRYRGGGSHDAREVDQTSRSEESDEAPPPAPTPKAAAPTLRTTTMADNGSTIDVMVLYTADARIGASPDDTDDPEAILSQVNLAVADTNAAYERSGVNQRLRLVNTSEVAYVESHDMKNVDLPRLKSPNDGFMDGVHALRDQYGADVVSLWVENGGGGPGGVGGWADLMDPITPNFASQAFSVVERGKANSSYAFAHFLGRNMGLRWDTYVDPATTPFPYAHGYVDVPHLFRTIMGLNDQCLDAEVNCVRIPYFSNPSVNYNGFATGNASTANEASVLNQTALTVANFRQSVLLPGVLSFSPTTYTANESGGAATLTVVRTLDTFGPVSVTYSTVDGTATAGSDYTATTGTLSWASGEGGAKTFAVPINNDGVNEGNEAFTVVLSNPTGGASLANATATVNIIESTEDAFPRNCALPAGWTMTSGANASWVVDAAQSTEGHCSLRSGAVGDLQKAQIQFAGAFQAGTITFKLRVSSELQYDCFQFIVDGTKKALGQGTANQCTDGADVPITGASGELGWRLVSIPITQGNHTLIWSFERDISFGGGANAAWIDDVVLPVAVTVSSVVSRKTHGAAGALDLDVDATKPVNGAVSVEPRAAGSSHAIVFKFNGTVMSAGTASATDVNGAAIGSASTSLSGNDVVVTLTGIADAKRVKVSLTGVNNLAGVFSPSIGFLRADVDGTRIVSEGDVTAVKAQAGLNASAGNARYDLDASGAITASDILIARGRVGNAL